MRRYWRYRWTRFRDDMSTPIPPTGTPLWHVVVMIFVFGISVITVLQRMLF